jgi:hypothetical protein
MVSQILALKKGQLVFQIPIGISNTNCHLRYQLSLKIPILSKAVAPPSVLLLNMSNDPTTTTTTTTTRATKWILELR